MDLWGILMFLFLAFLILSCCGYCCTSKTRGTVLSTPVVVTSATHTAPGGYPVTQQMQPPPGGYQTNVYAMPYPTHGGAAQMPMPMPMPMPSTQQPGHQAHMAPYPPAANSSMNPPPYDIAVAGIGSGQANNAHYEKQAPYNPSYTAQ